MGSLARALAIVVVMSIGIARADSDDKAPVSGTVSLPMPSGRGDAIWPAAISGDSIKLGDLLDDARATIVVTGAPSWCKPYCRSAYKYLATRQAAYTQQGLQLVGIASGANDSETEVIAATGATFTVLAGDRADELQDELVALLHDDVVPYVLIVEGRTITWALRGWPEGAAVSLEEALLARGLVEPVAEAGRRTMRGEVYFPVKSKGTTVDVGDWVGAAIAADQRRRAVIVLAGGVANDKLIKWLVKKHKTLTKANVEIVLFDPDASAKRIKKYKKLGVKFSAAAGPAATQAHADLSAATGSTGPVMAVLAADGSIKWWTTVDAETPTGGLQKALVDLGAL